MTSFSIEAQIRAKNENCKHLRKARKLPAVVYGKTQEPISLTLDSSEFLKLFRKTGETNIINLKADKNDIEVLVHDLQRDPISGDFTHVDFFALTRGEKLTTMVTLNFIGDSAAIKEGAILDEHIKEVEIKVLPKDLIDSIDVDISLLKEMGDTVKISELNIDSDKIEIMTADTVIVSATKPAKIEEISEDAPDAPVTGADEETTEA